MVGDGRWHFRERERRPATFRPIPERTRRIDALLDRRDSDVVVDWRAIRNPGKARNLPPAALSHPQPVVLLL